MPTTTWDPAHKNAALTLSGGNLVATSAAGSGASNCGVIATAQIFPVTKQYFEVTFSSTATAQYYSVGVMNGTASLSANIGATNGAAFTNKLLSGTVSQTYRNGTAANNYSVVLANTQVLRVAVDRTAERMWWAINNNTWSGSAVWMGSGATTDDPGTGTGGLDISAVSGPIFPAFSSAWTGDVATFNGGTAAFSYAVPSGYQALDAAIVRGTYTAWNPSDKSGGITLSNGNLTATCGGSTSSVRAIDSQTTGKYYWETTVNARASTTGFPAGVWSGAISALVGSNWPSSALSGICGVSFAGAVFVDGTNTGSVGAAIVATNVVCVAADFTAQRIWFRIGAAGNWNNSGTANPATGTGGLAITVGNTTAAYPGAWLGNNADQVVTNFGGSAFTGAVPAGFTSGFPVIPGGSVAAPTQARVMVMA